MPGDTAMGPLLERAADLSRAAAQLAVQAGTGGRRELRDLLRRMNSYYTHQIEGEQAAERQLVQGSWPDGAALDLYTT